MYGDDIYLKIESLSGEPLFEGVKELSSGTEIYGEGIKGKMNAGQRIRVTASRVKMGGYKLCLMLIELNRLKIQVLVLM